MKFIKLGIRKRTFNDQQKILKEPTKNDNLRTREKRWVHNKENQYND